MSAATETTEEIYVYLPDPEDEIWEFLPGTIVRVIEKKLSDNFGVINTRLVAVKA